jgi:hypothetical protein
VAIGEALVAFVLIDRSDIVLTRCGGSADYALPRDPDPDRTGVPVFRRRITIFAGQALVLIVLAVNLLGNRLCDTLNPD